jgi:hypothetical protein
MNFCGIAVYFKSAIKQTEFLLRLHSLQIQRKSQKPQKTNQFLNNNNKNNMWSEDKGFCLLVYNL